MFNKPPHATPVRKETAPPEIRDIYHLIQDAMGIPWAPANWQAYAMYPAALRLLWERFAPAVPSEALQAEALAITARAYKDVGRWYHPTFQPDLPEHERARVAWELDAFEYGNPQLLIQQMVLAEALKTGVCGNDIGRGKPAPKSHYRHAEIVMVEEEAAPKDVRAIYKDIEKTLKTPVVNSDYKAMAKWPAFLAPVWDDIKLYRTHAEAKELVGVLERMARGAAAGMSPAFRISEAELRAAITDDKDWQNFTRIVQLFSTQLPMLIVNVAIARTAIAGGPAVPPQLAERRK